MTVLLEYLLDLLFKTLAKKVGEHAPPDHPVCTAYATNNTDDLLRCHSDGYCTINILQSQQNEMDTGGQRRMCALHVLQNAKRHQFD